MGIWLASILPTKIMEMLPAITLIAIGIIVEKRYIGRIAILSNAVALTTFFYKYPISPFLTLYINVLTIVGVIAIISYVTEIRLPRQFYWIAGIFSSVISGGLLLYGAML